MQNKRCTKCKKEYPATAEYFCVDKRRKDDLHSWCRKCEKQYVKQYSQEHKAERHQKYRQYYKTIPGYLRYIFRAMFCRCNSPKREGYKYYGGRGIKVKFNSFDDFYDYVVNKLKVDPRGLTIDRINTDKHYERGNIRFVSQAVNNRNKRAKAEKGTK